MAPPELFFFQSCLSNNIDSINCGKLIIFVIYFSHHESTDWQGDPVWQSKIKSYLEQQIKLLLINVLLTHYIHQQRNKTQAGELRSWCLFRSDSTNTYAHTNMLLLHCSLSALGTRCFNKAVSCMINHLWTQVFYSNTQSQHCTVPLKSKDLD